MSRSIPDINLPKVLLSTGSGYTFDIPTGTFGGITTYPGGGWFVGNTYPGGYPAGWGHYLYTSYGYPRDVGGWVAEGAASFTEGDAATQIVDYVLYDRGPVRKRQRFIIYYAGGFKDCVSGLTYPAADGPANGVVTSNGTGNLSVRSVLTLPGGGLCVVKAGDEIVTSSSVLQDDNHLTMDLAASTTYRFRLFIPFALGAVAEGIKLAMAGTVGVSVLQFAIQIWDPSTGSTALTVRKVALNDAGGAALTSNVNSFATIEGTIATSTAGTLKLQWAQQASGGVGTTVLAGASMEIQKVS